MVNEAKHLLDIALEPVWITRFDHIHSGDCCPLHLGESLIYVLGVEERGRTTSSVGVLQYASYNKIYADFPIALPIGYLKFIESAKRFYQPWERGPLVQFLNVPFPSSVLYARFLALLGSGELYSDRAGTWWDQSLRSWPYLFGISDFALGKVEAWAPGYFTS